MKLKFHVKKLWLHIFLGITKKVFNIPFDVFFKFSHWETKQKKKKTIGTNYVILKTIGQKWHTHTFFCIAIDSFHKQAPFIWIILLIIHFHLI